MRKALEILGHLTDLDIEWLRENGKHRYLPQGTQLIEAGVPLHAIYFVLDGQMQVVTGPKNFPVATLLSGEVLGELSLVDPRPPQVSVYALTRAHILDVPRSALDNRIAADQAFAARLYFALAAYMAIRLRATTSRLGYGSAGPGGIDSDLLEDQQLNEISRAANHFNGLLQRLRVDVHSTPPM